MIDQRVVAIHEAGHLIAGVACGIDVIGIEMRSDYAVTNHYDWDKNLLIPRNNAIYSLGGFVAELLSDHEWCADSFWILSTMEMIERNDDAIQQCPNPRRLSFAKKEVRRCHDAGKFFTMPY